MGVKGNATAPGEGGGQQGGGVGGSDIGGRGMRAWEGVGLKIALLITQSST